MLNSTVIALLERATSHYDQRPYELNSREDLATVLLQNPQAQ
jgi:hypothetical protein